MEGVKQQQAHIVNLSLMPCPNCGSTDRWEDMHAVKRTHNNPEIVVSCDCGIGELVVVVE